MKDTGKTLRTKTKLERIMFELDITAKEIHLGTGIAYPTLFNVINARKTSFRERTLRDLERFLNMSRDQFLGFETSAPALSITQVPNAEPKQ